MAVARLNVDVLTIICDFLTDVSHILSFALTCSALHPVAIGRLLTMRPIYLGESASIRQFHSFLFADTVARARHIRALEIGTRLRLPRYLRAIQHLWAIQADDDPLLIDILNLCPHLERITVVLRATPPRGTNNPRISDVIADIQSLRSLTVHGELADTFEFFNGIRAPLRMLGIHCNSLKGVDWPPAALEKVLSRFAPTLEELELARFSSYPYEAEGDIWTPSRSIFTLTQYPTVRSFSVTAFKGMPSLEHLQYLFPALDGTLALSPMREWDNEDNFAAVRAANQRAQDSNNGTPSSHAWKRLARVVCSVPMFYVLGLRCPIGLVMLHNVTTRHLAPALREHPIPRLNLSLNLDRALEVFDGLFPPELGDTLTHLTLFCEETLYGCRENGAEAAGIAWHRWDKILDGLQTSLLPLHSVTHLRVVFYCDVVQADRLPDAREKEEYHRALRGPPFERAEETAASLVRAVPSLKYVFLTAAGYLESYIAGGSVLPHRWHAAGAWRVTEPQTSGMKDKDGWPVLVGLHDDVAETIIRKEELVLNLSEADEAVLCKHGNLECETLVRAKRCGLWRLGLRLWRLSFRP